VTSLVAELANVEKVGSGVGVEVMDACLATMGLKFGSSVLL
jgi:hypothetical protein